MGKKYTTDEIEVGGHMLDALMMTSLDTVVTNSSSYFTTSGGTLTGDLTVNGDGYSIAGWGVGTSDTPVGKIFNNSGVFHVRAETGRQIAFGNVTNGEAVRINATGSVGIGTTSPGVKLDVIGEIRGTGSIKVDGDVTGNPYFGLYQNGNEKAYIQYVDSGDNLTLQSDGIFTFRTASSERVRITSGGNVGIGTTSPVSQLEVGDSESGGSGVTISSLYSSSNAYLNFRTGHPNNDLVWNTANIGATDDGNYNGQLNFRTSTSGRATPTTKMVIKATGNVGIGTTSPNSSLQVGLGTTNQQSSVASIGTSVDGLTSVLSLVNQGGNDTDGNGVSLDFHNDANWSSTGRISVIHPTATTGESTNSSMQFSTYGTVGSTTTFEPRMTIDYQGNVGIGTTIPQAPLVISNSSAETLELNNNISSGSRIISYNRSNNTFRPLRLEGLTHIFGISANEKMRIDSSGKVGIGITNPTGKLTVVSDNEYNSGGGLRLQSSSSADRTLLYFSTSQSNEVSTIQSYRDGTGNGVKPLLLNPQGGNVGIGTTSPVSQLEVTGDINASGFMNEEGGNKNRLLLPKGASYNGNGSQAGAIKITLPVLWTNTMMRITIKVFDYSIGESFDVTVGGYNYVGSGSGGSWINTSAWISSQSDKDRNFTVRFGNDGSKAIIYIGELNSYWTYLKVNVIDVELNHNSTVNDWSTTSWAIGLESSSFQNVSRTHSDCQVNNWKRSGQNVYYASGTGKVGIGTTNPSAKLDVFGDLRVSYDASNFFTIEPISNGNVYFKPSGGSIHVAKTTVNNQIFLYDYTGSSTRWGEYDASSINLKTSTNTTGILLNTDGNSYINTGNVGIGTTSPGYTLDVNGSLHSTNINIADGIYHEGDTNTYMQFHSSDQWRVVTGGTERLEVNNTQVTVANNLQVGGSIYASQYIYHTGDTNTYMRFPSNDTISWDTAGSERMRINSSGNIGIGTTAPSYKLHVAGNTYANGSVIGSSDLWLRDQSSAYSTELKMQNNTHTIGIDYQNNETLRFITRSGVTTVPITFAMRTGTINAATFTQTSDERLKTKISDLSCDNINVSWKSFEMKDNEGEYRTGVVAQELEQKHPEFVNTNDEGFKSVKYIDLLIAKIAELEARLEKLEK